jgi:hypothetical protein
MQSIKNGIYRHIRSQKLFRVIGCGRNVSSAKWEIMYESMEANYVRDLTEDKNRMIFLPRKTKSIAPITQFIPAFKYEARFMLFVKPCGARYEY